jgi:hypothetical protein
MYMDMDMHGATARISWNSSICNPIIKNQRYPGVGTCSRHTSEGKLVAWGSNSYRQCDVPLILESEYVISVSWG